MKSIYIVGEAWGQEEERDRRAFVGPSGQVLDGLLRQFGLNRGSVIAIENVFNFRPERNDLETLMTKDSKLAAPNVPLWKPKTWLHRDYAESVHGLRARIADAQPNIVLALGNTPLWALAGVSGIKKWRGSPLSCSFAPIKILPTYHPAAVIRQWTLRPIVLADLEKTIRESEFPDLRRPERFIHYAPTLSEIEDFYHEYIVPSELVSIDIETKNGTITEVGFAPSPSRALVIPFWDRAAPDGNFWRTLEDELVAWSWVRRVCAEKRALGQNFQYDMQYLWRTVGIPNPRFAADTMLMHHSLQPEMEKGLGFLGSVYTDEPAWKFMRTQNETLKKED